MVVVVVLPVLVVKADVCSNCRGEPPHEVRQDNFPQPAMRRRNAGPINWGLLMERMLHHQLMVSSCCVGSTFCSCVVRFIVLRAGPSLPHPEFNVARPTAATGAENKFSAGKVPPGCLRHVPPHVWQY